MHMKVFWGWPVFLAAALSVTSCCGLLSQGDGEETSSGIEPTTHHAKTPEFEGSYDIEDPNYEELTLEISKRGDYFYLEWIIPASEPWHAYGVQVGNYLGACEGGEDATLALYKLDGTKLSALWCDGEKVSPFDTTAGAQPLEPSSRNFAGTYRGENVYSETDEHYNYTLRLERSGDLYKAEEQFEGGTSAQGFGFALDDVIIMGFPVGGCMIVKLLEANGSRLDGKLFYSYLDEEKETERVSLGTSKASRE